MLPFRAVQGHLKLEGLTNLNASAIKFYDFDIPNAEVDPEILKRGGGAFMLATLVDQRKIF